MKWKRITLEDKPLMEKFYHYSLSKGCEQCFGNNYLWSEIYKTQVGFFMDTMIFYNAKFQSVSFPIGEKPLQAVQGLLDYFESEGKTFKMGLVTPQQFEMLEKEFPGKFKIRYNRDEADYLYDTQALITLPGKKLHAKRNHINRFRENYPDWSFEVISNDNEAECIEMAQKWLAMAPDGESDDKKQELGVTIRAIKERNEIGLDGGLIRAGGKVVAFALGEKISNDTYVVHIEKAYADMQGAYPMINREFAAYYAKECNYVNREEDLGVEGLRKAKLSYQPVMIYEKGLVTFA